ncbi:unnamed protein product, partial [Strongylus vulgaris]
VTLPSALEPALLYAPCPHDLGCPKLGLSVCSFPVKWQVIRADGKKSPRERAGFESGKFSFMILEKGIRQPQTSMARILKTNYNRTELPVFCC